MWPHYRSLISILILAFSAAASAQNLIWSVEPLVWRATQSNDWAYVNDERLPQQNITYKTIDFGYSQGIRFGVHYQCLLDLLLNYTYYHTSTKDAANGPMQPAFLGSVTAKPAHSYLYNSGNVTQSINLNSLAIDFGKQLQPLETLTLLPYVGVLGSSIKQSISANYLGSTSVEEKITHHFWGIGPQVGFKLDAALWPDCHYNPTFFANFATAYLIAEWDIKDVAQTTTQTYNVISNPPSLGTLTLQSAIGVQIQYQHFAFSIAYELNDWFNQNQIFDNDTGAHNNDLILQGINFKLTYQ